MPGSTINFNSNRILANASKVWVDVAVPGAGARMTLHTDGTPESVANPNAKHLGLTEAGATLKFAVEVQSFEADELTAPWKQQLTGEQATISGNFLQVEDWTLLGLITPGGTKSTGSGYESLTFGGATTVTTKPVALIAPSSENANKFVVFQLYKAFQQAGIEVTMSRKDFSKVPFEFVGLTDTSRVEGDQVGNFWRQIP